MASSAHHLAVPQVAHEHFARNFVKTAVCELRFPVLYELEAAQPPLAFARALRKEYPSHELREAVQISLGSRSSRGAAHVHVFQSKQGRWSVTLRSSSLSLETARYSAFAEFQERLGHIIETCQSFIDSDFFTRVGIRYINALPYDRGQIASWLNPLLAPALVTGVYGDVSEYAQQVRGTTPDGGYYMQSGLAQSDQGPAYLVDLDFYADDVEVKSSLNTVRKLHERQYEMFMWAVGDEARRVMRGAK